MSWFYLALLAPFLYAIVNLFDDNLLRLVYKSPYVATAFAGAFGAAPLLSLMFIRASNFALSSCLVAGLAGFLTVVYYFFYFRGLQADTPSTVVVFLSLEPALIPFLAYFLNGERLNAPEIFGFVLVLAGSIGIATVNLRRWQFSKALLPSLIAIVFMDAAAVLSKYAYQHSQFYPAYMFYSAGMGLGGLCFFIGKYPENSMRVAKIFNQAKALVLVFALAEAINLMAEFTLNLAISRGPVSLVKVIESSQPIYVLLLAVVLYPLAPRFFREAKAGQLTKKFSFLGVILVGLILIGLTSSGP